MVRIMVMIVMLTYWSSGLGRCRHVSMARDMFDDSLRMRLELAQFIGSLRCCRCSGYASLVIRIHMGGKPFFFDL